MRNILSVGLLLLAIVSQIQAAPTSDADNTVTGAEATASLRSRPGSAGNATYLFFAQGTELHRTTVGDSDSSAKLLASDGKVYYTEADCAEHYVYWTDDTAKAIKRANYDGSGVESVITDAELFAHGGFAVDYLSGNIFWTLNDQGSKWIVVSKLGAISAGRHKVVEDPQLNPRHETNGEWGTIAVHPGRGALYWTSGPPRSIQVADMDGSNRRQLVDDVFAFYLTVDLYGDQICWTNYFQDDGYDYELYCLSLDGGSKRLIRDFGNRQKYVWGIAASPDRLYWSDFNDKTVRSINKTGEDASLHVDNNVSGGTEVNVWGIVFAPPMCPIDVTNACAIGNGGCSHICLPLSGGQKKCVL